MISCAEDLPQHVALPRGCRTDLEKMLCGLGVALDVRETTFRPSTAAADGGIQGLYGALARDNEAPVAGWRIDQVTMEATPWLVDDRRAGGATRTRRGCERKSGVRVRKRDDRRTGHRWQATGRSSRAR